MLNMLRVWQCHRRLRVVPGVVCLLLMMASIQVRAEQFAGKVVGISDGDTSSV